jgi:hypothetical protein
MAARHPGRRSPSPVEIGVAARFLAPARKTARKPQGARNGRNAEPASAHRRPALRRARAVFGHRLAIARRCAVADRTASAALSRTPSGGGGHTHGFMPCSPAPRPPTLTTKGNT